MSVPYKLHQGNCLEYLREMESESVDVIITDPPYLVTITSQSKRTPSFDKLKEHDWTLPLDWMVEAVRVLKDGGAFYSWICAEEMTIYQKGLKSLGMRIFNNLVWIKTNPLPSFTKKIYRNAAEFSFYGAKGKRINYFQPRTQQELLGYWMYPIVGGEERTEHPTQKPLEIIDTWVENSCPPNGVVLDPFMGSGTTGVSCMKFGRKFIGCEIEPKYFAIAEKRIQQAAQQPSFWHEAQQSVHLTASGAGGRGQNSLQSSFIADDPSAKNGGR